MQIEFKSNYPDSLPHTYGNGNGTVHIYIDNKVFLAADENVSDPIALMVEPRSIFPDAYLWLEKNWKLFKYIFTFDSNLLILPNAKLFLYGQITAEYPNHPKTKGVSMVASDKDFCEGHRQRKRVAQTLKPIIDTFGRFDGGAFCDDKDYLANYKFNVAMENYSDGHYFTEKICNCFASKTVPIYYGCPNLERYFNMEGVIYCRTPEQVIKTVQTLVNENLIEKAYEYRKPAIEDNYQRVQKYRRFAPLLLDMYGELLEELADGRTIDHI